MFMMSLSLIYLSLIWLYFSSSKAVLKTVQQTIFKNKALLFTLLIFLLYLVGLLYSNDLQTGLQEVKTKLPFLVLPLVFAHPNLDLNRLKKNKLLLLFSLTTVVVSFINFSVFQLVSNAENTRQMSLFYSHIRFSICASFSMLFFLHLIFSNAQKSVSVLYFFFIGWMGFYLVYSQSYTGLALCLIGLVLYTLKCQKIARSLRILFSGFILLIFVFSFFKINQEYQFFKNRSQINQNNFKQYTVNQNAYLHDFKNTQVENGYYIWRNICEEELKTCWNKASHQDYSKADQKQNPQYATLIRYMTSLGLTKDSVGFSKLNDAQIKEIEQGQTNYRFSHLSKFQQRIYETLWELDYYNQGIAPINGSLVQRFAYWKTGLKTYLNNNLLFGVGSGDLKIAMQPHFLDSKLKDHAKFWNKPHNQFITFLVLFGAVGCLVLILTMLIAFSHSSLLFKIVTLVLFLSMLTEDTLDTQAGATIFSFFYTLLSYKKSE